jgi:hypothetical protein
MGWQVVALFAFYGRALEIITISIVRPLFSSFLKKILYALFFVIVFFALQKDFMPHFRLWFFS